MARPLEHLAALAVILFFVPLKVDVSGMSLYLADLQSIAALGVLGIALFRGQLKQTTIKGIGFVLVFVIYILLVGILNDVPFKLVLTEMVQWLSVAAFLGFLHQAGLLASPRFLSTVTLYAFAGAIYTAAWHIMQPGFSDFKQLANTKYLFGFCCVMLYLMRDHIRFSHVLLGIALILLVMSGERKALLGVIVMVACDYAFCRKVGDRRTQDTFNILGFMVLFGAIIAAFSTGYLIGLPAMLDHLEFTQFDILFADQEQARWDSEVWRKLLLANGFSLFLEHPIFGVGPKMLPEYMVDYFYNQELAIYTHNFALDVAIEYGAVGLTILIGGFVLSMRQLFRQRMQNPVAFLLAAYIFAMVLFVAFNTTIMFMFLFPFFVNTRIELEPNIKSSTNTRLNHTATTDRSLSNVVIHKDK
ncbi:O-antigen ligase family protein [Enterovibrio sp. 27052020O]|uniref:O-antigen ligase family protein n=1 Tax=Enterovibrio sp. 27052020O TaxID=3241166 RepID=UPI00388FA143